MMLAHARRSWLGAALATALIAGFAVMTVQPSEAAAAPQRVELPELHTETSTTYRNPDGTFTLEQHARPIRIKQYGEWADIDPTLKRNPDGSVAPVATATPVSFSGGGDTPLATLGTPGKSLTLGWPGELPEPTLDGSTATYPEVLPGVDLKVNADTDGFSQVLVVKAREAAANPALKQLTFDTTTEGLSLSADEHGNLQATDNNGELVFTAPTPRMWDSSGPEANRIREDNPGLLRGGAAEIPELSQSTPTGAREAAMDVSLSGDQLNIMPDQQLLTGPDTVYPVMIDPYFTSHRSNWTAVWQNYPNTSYWNSGDEARVGYESETGMTNRSYFAMNLAGMHGKRILSATFSAYETWAWSCNARPVELWMTGGISPSTTWNNQPGWISHFGTADVAHGYSGNCPAANVEFTATSEVRHALDQGWPDITLMLKASNEGDTWAWKKFANNPTLSITYNSIPGAPTDLTVDGRAAANPNPVVGSTRPTFRGKVHDADSDAQLWTFFDVFHQEIDGTWTQIANPSQQNLRPGDIATVQMPEDLEHLGVYRVKSRSWDGDAWSPFSDYLTFSVDTVGPEIAPTVSSTDYGSNLDLTYGGIGKTGDFTFDPNGETDITGFRYGWNDPPTVDVVASTGESVITAVTPPAPDASNPTRGGLLTLYVQSVDGAGRTSPLTEYKFKVGQATAGAGNWKLDDAAGATTLADSSGNGHDLTVNGSISGQPGRLAGGPGQVGATAVSFDGTDDTAATSGPVVDTSKSFTVATWVKSDNNVGWQSMVSARGDRNSAFFLRKNEDRWRFTAVKDSQKDELVEAYSTSTTPIGSWTHVAGVYDAGAKEIRLYVNGMLEASAPVEQIFEATGPLELGTDIWGGVSPSNTPFAGQLSDVQVWDRVVFGAELAPLASTLVGNWWLDGDGYDDSPYSHGASFYGGVTEAANRFGDPWSAIDVNGTDGYLATGGQVLKTDNSYTITAWVNPDQLSTWQAAAATEHGAGWRTFLGIHATSNNWTFGAVSPDDSAGNMAQSGIQAEPGQWAHLAGVHDTANRQLRLYVNGELAATAALNHPVGSATGSLTIGQARAYEKPYWFFDGKIDDVRAYQGVLSESAIRELASDKP